MKHSKENIILLLHAILSSLDKSYDSLSQSSLEYIVSNLKIINTIVSTENKNDKSKINKEEECDLTDLSESQLLNKLKKCVDTDDNYSLDDLDDLID